MSLEQTELTIGGTSFKGVWIATRLETLLSQQEKLLELNTDVSKLANEIEGIKGTVAKAEVITKDIGDVGKKLKTLTKEVEDLWQGMDYLSNPLK